MQCPNCKRTFDHLNKVKFGAHKRWCVRSTTNEESPSSPVGAVATSNLTDSDLKPRKLFENVSIDLELDVTSHCSKLEQSSESDTDKQTSTCNNMLGVDRLQTFGSFDNQDNHETPSDNIFDLDDNNDYSQKLEKNMERLEKQLQHKQPMSNALKALAALSKLLNQTNSPKYLYDSILSSL